MLVQGIQSMQTDKDLYVASEATWVDGNRNILGEESSERTQALLGSLLVIRRITGHQPYHLWPTCDPHHTSASLAYPEQILSQTRQIGWFRSTTRSALA